MSFNNYHIDLWKSSLVKDKGAHYLFGFALIGIAFWVGAQANALFGFFGFLIFFTLGVTMICEAYRKKK